MSQSARALPSPDIVMQMALILNEAWHEYYALFGVEPHGNIKQMAALLELKSAGKRIAALSESAEHPDTARLDWLDRPGHWIEPHEDDAVRSFHVPRKQAHYYIKGVKIAAGAPTAREAIDIALRDERGSQS